MSKTVNSEKLMVKKAKEARELEKWERVRKTPDPNHYFVILMIVVGVIYIVDEITSNINSSLQPQALFEFFNITSRDVSDPLYSKALNKMAIATILSYLCTILMPFYRSLADRYGRRVFLALNTCMFGVGLLIVMLSPNIYVYIIGVGIITFVVPNDVQVMYIMEVAPKKHRAKLCSMTKAIALVSVSLIGVLRTTFLTDNPSSWRMVYLIPAIVALAVGLVSVLFVRETPAFLDERIEYLRSSDEEREQKAKAQKESQSAQNGGVINAIKFIISHKQTRAVALAALLFAGTSVYTAYYATIMEGGMTSEQVNTALIIYPFANGTLTFVSGFLSDKYGRKKMCIGLGTCTVILLTLFILSCQLGWGPVAAGLAYGASIGCLWSVSDTLCLTIPGESVPTKIRASVMGTMSMILIIGSLIGGIIVVVGQNFVDMGWLCLGVCVPFMVVSLIILQTKVHETKDVDIDKVTGMEWE